MLYYLCIERSLLILIWISLLSSKDEQIQEYFSRYRNIRKKDISYMKRGE